MKRKLMSAKISNNRPILDYGLFSIRTIIIFLIISSFFYERTANGTLSDTFVSVAKNIKPSVVNIRTAKALKRDTSNRGRRNPFNGVSPKNLPHKQSRKGSEINSQGSGVIANKKGYIITNNHIVEGADEIIVKLYDDREFKAVIIGRDKKTNMAVLKIDAENLEPAEFGNSDSLETGEIVFAIGSSFDLGQVVTSGIISAKGSVNTRIAEYEAYLQTDANINPGNSGGPLVNLPGKVVGINSVMEEQISNYHGINFAIPINIVKRIMKDLIEYGKVKRSWLGVTAQTITPQLQGILGLKNNMGTLISGIEPNSPAEDAGLMSGDVIIEYDGKKVKDLFHLRRLVTTTEINREVELVVIRNGGNIRLNVTITELSKVDTINKKSLFKYLGFIVQNLTRELAVNMGYEGEKGVIITNIKADSPAFKAGLVVGDLIVEIQHKTVANVDDFLQVILDINREDEILVFIKRQNGTSRFVVLKIAKED